MATPKPSLVSLGIAKVVSILEDGQKIVFDVEAVDGHIEENVTVFLVGNNIPFGSHHLQGCQVGSLYSVSLSRYGDGKPLFISAIMNTARRRDWHRLNRKKRARINQTLTLLAASAIIAIPFLVMFIMALLGFLSSQ